jgi:DNA-binding LytR/AlgR family response regulator
LKKVLIIEDTGNLSDRIENILSSAEFKIFSSQNIKEGFNIAIRYLPDLILFCCNSNSNGLSFLEKFSSEDSLSAVPLIVIAENYSFEEQRKVMELGADDYLPENYLTKSLLNSINKRFTRLEKLKQSVHTSINSFDEYENETGNDDHILIKIGSKLKLVEFSDIVCITALKEYSKLITKDNCKIVVRKSLKKWINTLPAKSFLRIHRATIININYIEDITKTNDRTYTVHLKYIKESFDFSHRYANLMRHTFPT